jgi:hypothetical protein
VQPPRHKRASVGELAAGNVALRAELDAVYALLGAIADYAEMPLPVADNWDAYHGKTGLRMTEIRSYARHAVDNRGLGLERIIRDTAELRARGALDLGYEPHPASIRKPADGHHLPRWCWCGSDHSSPFTRYIPPSTNGGAANGLLA